MRCDMQLTCKWETFTSTQIFVIKFEWSQNRLNVEIGKKLRLFLFWTVWWTFRAKENLFEALNKYGAFCAAVYN